MVNYFVQFIFQHIVKPPKIISILAYCIQLLVFGQDIFQILFDQQSQSFMNTFIIVSVYL